MRPSANGSSPAMTAAMALRIAAASAVASSVTQLEPYLLGQIAAAPEQVKDGIELEALANTARDLFQRLASTSSHVPSALGEGIRAIAQGVDARARTAALFFELVVEVLVRRVVEQALDLL